MEQTSTITGAQAILIEDEESVRRATVQTLELGGFQVQACADAEQALILLSTAVANYPGIIVTDVRLPGRSGLALLNQINTADSDLPVIVVTGHGDVGMAVEAMRAGAYDFIEKPFSAERLVETARRAQEKRRLILENRRLRQAWIEHPETPPLVGQSAAIERLRTLIASIGPTNADVLINGQTGTGKEVVARQLHAASGRTGPFVAINCGALPESVFESEIFGHEAGAFTGAQKRRIGKLEHAQGGTVFLDEIESMPLPLQIKLLRVLQERQLERLGSNELIAFDCRVIAASKSDLLQLAAQGGFREDLYYRIGVVSIALPRLCDRRDDIPLLLAHFMQAAALRYRREIAPWTQQQMAGWQQKDWPGNVRELRNFADRWVLGVVDLVADQEADVVEAAAMSLPQQLDACERALIERALLATGANVANAADQLGIPRKTLYDKMKKYDLPAGRSITS
ncbi:two-component system C4-dicarboxylate transport response regulator DctD [Herbaspirillum sp. Sphag1AN]|uniref:sigma-54-dependent transcriptional regulator n=1 Tax=unclassified Herbaspirillum TaxID=2624150 RepID=UPI00160FEA7B|nr:MULTISPECIES: sigma-54 dependent transcriptional regulator [unclassified Herbaspirillum]MBB3211619.1 two-component system C4-dicarboxylate transport response regulator DctD [Herbaspirillum sp. Sphag1AN]MBB3245113.1 two-component system C4-dicarboxylate transport response regulator DctD [Herbaspirillum sp. Sphag64]